MNQRLRSGLKRARDVDVVLWRRLVERVAKAGLECPTDAEAGDSDFPACLDGAVANAPCSSRVLYSAKDPDLPRVLVPCGLHAGTLRLPVVPLDDASNAIIPLLTSNVGVDDMDVLLRVREDTTEFMSALLAASAGNWCFRHDVARRVGTRLVLQAERKGDVEGCDEWDDEGASPHEGIEPPQSVPKFSMFLERLLPRIQRGVSLPPLPPSTSVAGLHSSGRLEITKEDVAASLAAVGFI